MNIKVIIEPGEDGYFVAHVPLAEELLVSGQDEG